MDNTTEIDELILEGIVTTQNADGSTNISPMGPRSDREVSSLVLRPFKSSQTYKNLKHHPQGVFHLTDDVDLIARAAVGETVAATLTPAGHVKGMILSKACRWFEFRVARIDESTERVTIACDIVGRGEIRPFLGFNRAKHAVLEAAILATRIGIIPLHEILSELERLEVLVKKTAGQQERRAFEFLRSFIHSRRKPLHEA